MELLNTVFYYILLLVLQLVVPHICHLSSKPNFKIFLPRCAKNYLFDYVYWQQTNNVLLWVNSEERTTVQETIYLLTMKIIKKSN